MDKTMNNHQVSETLKKFSPLDYKGHYFDLDGTLISSEERHFWAYQQVLKQNPQLKISRQWNNEDFRGQTDEYVCKTFFPDNDSNHIIAEKEKAYINSLEKNDQQDVENPPIKLTLGLIPYLTVLRSLDHKLCIVTACSQDEANHVLTAAGIIHFFDHIICRQTTTRSKPYPDPYLHAMDLCSLKASDGIAYEDSVPGLTSARNAGLKTILITAHQAVDFKPFHEDWARDFSALTP